MALRIGTSGFSYPEWKGKFYPEGLQQKKMFGFYAERFSTVEINATFYRFPEEALVLGWLAAAPEGFLYSVKAPQRLTHKARLLGCDADRDAFCARVGLLGAHLGAVLFQLPPFFKRTPETLEAVRAFAGGMPKGIRAAFELRHESWHDESLYAALRDAGAALCISDSEKLRTPFVPTAGFSYLRLRDQGYTEAELLAFLQKLDDASSDDGFVYFKHEDEARGPELAVRLRELAASRAR